MMAVNLMIQLTEAASSGKLLKQHRSMSRKGNSNSPVERFFGSLKLDRCVGTERQEAIADVREYVAVNSRRLFHSTPMDYEKTLNKVSGIT